MGTYYLFTVFQPTFLKRKTLHYMWFSKILQLDNCESLTESADKNNFNNTLRPTELQTKRCPTKRQMFVHFLDFHYLKAWHSNSPCLHCAQCSSFYNYNIAFRWSRFHVGCSFNIGDPWRRFRTLMRQIA